MSRILQHTIWARGAVPPEEYKYRNLKRVWLPLYDALLVWAGLVAARYGVPALDAKLSDAASDAAGLTLSGVALLCLLGVVIPRLWRLEVAAKTVLLTILFGYFSVLRTLDTELGTDARAFVSVIALVACIPILIRFNMLAEESRQRTTDQTAVR